MHDSKTRRPRSPFRGVVSTHLRRRRYADLCSSPCYSPPSAPSKSPLFIANGFRIMMPGWLRDPIQIPRVSSSEPTLPPLSSSSLTPSTLTTRVQGCYCPRRDCSLSLSLSLCPSLFRDLSNNLLCAIYRRDAGPLCPRPPSPLSTQRDIQRDVSLSFFPFFPFSLSPSLYSPSFCLGNRGSKSAGRKIRKIEWILIRERDYPN